MWRRVLLYLTLIVLVSCRGYALPSRRARTDATCGFASCPAVKSDMINVHLVPHTHDDVGWLKTVDQYFYGRFSNIQRAGVQYIIDSVVAELQKDPARRFIYVETAYFWQWWLQQDETMRSQVRALVDSGQLEFIGGGWSMNDEAVTHYHSTIDQFTWGLRKLKDTFGECGRPRVGWQIDPFGHSRETASLMAQMGFDGLFFARLDWQDKVIRLLRNTSELVWEASQNLGASSSLFTSVLYYFYTAPPDFCFDINCSDDPIIEDPLSPDYNVDKRVQKFIKRIHQQDVFFRTNNIMFTMGGDFNYQQADTWYKNMDKLIKYINAQQTEGGKINVVYSTPSCYLKAVNDAQLTWTTKQDDFFPYSSDPHSFWTGYFTSRPTLKYFERLGNNFLQVCKQLLVLSDTPEEQWQDLSSLREVMGIMQHHDAITGTEKQHVAFDYALRLSQAFDNCQKSTEIALNKLMTIQPPGDLRLSPCLLTNISQCEVSETSDTFVVTLYNPRAQPVTYMARVPVTANQYTVKSTEGEEVTQMLPIHPSVLSIPGRDSIATYELVFKTNLPALGFKSYYVKKGEPLSHPVPSVAAGDTFSLGNEKLRAELDPATGLLKTLRVGEQTINVTQEFSYYEAAQGSNIGFKSKSSGAYIFRPQEQDPVSFLSPVQVNKYSGPLVEETHQIYSDWISQVIRTYKDEDYLEFEWLVGPIPIEDAVGKEVITRYTTDWATNGVFNTDSNGREVLQRKRNFRPSWHLFLLEEPVSGNYYPITTTISIENGTSELLILTDRAQGGSSINDGQLELMIHRRLLNDDAHGVGEALNEEAFGTGLVTRGRHIMVLGSNTDSPTARARQRQLTSREMVLKPWMLFTPTKLAFEEWTAAYKTQWSGLKTPLPDNVNLLTLEPWTETEILLRVEHYLENSDDPVLSGPASVELEDIFNDISILSASETTLAGNQWVEDNDRLEWKVDESAKYAGDSQQLSAPNTKESGATSKTAVSLDSMQIRTYVVQTKAD